MPTKIATAEDVQAELKNLLAMTEGENPSRTKLAAAISELASKVAGTKPIKYYLADNYVQVYSIFESYGRVLHVTQDLMEVEDRLLKIREAILKLFQGNKNLTYPDIGEVVVDGVPGGRNKMIVNFTIGMYGPGSFTDEYIALFDKVLGRFPEEKP